MSDLPERGWAGYGSPGHPLTPKHKPRNWYANDPLTQRRVHTILFCEEIAEYRMRHEGVLPELLMCVQEIGMRRETRP